MSGSAIYDDEALLDLMMERQRVAGYIPSSHWLPYETTTLAAIKKTGLSKFLTVPNSFGISGAHIVGKPSILKRITYRLFRAATGKEAYALGPIKERSAEEQVAAISADFAEALYIAEGGAKILSITDSLLGG